ncbi:hypothetical protein Dsin_016159 [Dipteronia sinensis]|uniref:Cytochrome P450 n=1 Tax=Dipteronia sinensis TaxID=43782 RepID=A0AAE0ADH2_9ROSI|nr:hypothetical protein Dsin_016159 [Dipteronia sinensis]
MQLLPYSISLQYYCIILAITFLVFLIYVYTKNKVICTFPLVGILPQILVNIHRFHDMLTEILHETKGTFVVKGAWFVPIDMLVTCDPANIHSMMAANFSKYVKGPEWRKRLAIFGQHNVINTDFDEWKLHRNTYRAFLTHHKFQELIANIIPDIIDKGVIPVLEHVSERGLMVDLQELFSRYTFDFANMIAIGSNPNSLQIGFPESPFAKALDDAWEAIFVRHLVPESFWKLLRWLRIGKESKLSSGRKVIDKFCEEHISTTKKEAMAAAREDHGASFSLLNCYLTGQAVTGPAPAEKVMRDMITNTILATRDTCSTALSWFFWLLSKNPSVEIKIREELLTTTTTTDQMVMINLVDLSKLVYLHAAICETMRLFPPAPYQSRTPIEPQTLPSGHNVNPNTNVLISAYAMARMASVWGDDCREFKPERWITENGKIKYEPPHKFFAFNTGPRICLGKDVAFMVMKAITATIINNYDVQVVENHPVSPKLSIMFRMKHGLLARVKNRKFV